MKYNSPVLGLLASWCGEMSIYVEVDILESSRFFDLMFFCWERRCPSLVAMDFWGCLEINDPVILGQDVI